MLVGKNEPIEPNPKDPWGSDRLDREKIGENLTRLIRSVSQPFVLSVQAPWGHGKTSFINMWRAQLEKDQHVCLYFNAWKNDFSGDPLVSFCGALWGDLDRKLRSIGKGGQAQRQLVDLLEKAVDAAASIAASAPRNAFRIVSGGLADPASASQPERLKEHIKARVQAYSNEIRTIDEFREELGRFANVLSSEEIGYLAPLVVFVDELDRCRPTYSVELLEAIKHLFAAEGIVIVLSLDRKQLGHTVRQMFGSECDVDGYLKRFIDVPFNLPPLSTEDFCAMLNSRMKADEIPTIKNARFSGNIGNIICGWAQLFDMSLRDIERCFDRVNIALRTASKLGDDTIHVLLFLAALQTVRNDLYEEFLSTEKSTPQLLEQVWGTNPTRRFYFDRHCAFIEVATICARDGNAAAEKRLQELRESPTNASGHENLAWSRLMYLKEFLDHNREGFSETLARRWFGNAMTLLDLAHAFEPSD